MQKVEKKVEMMGVVMAWEWASLFAQLRVTGAPMWWESKLVSRTAAMLVNRMDVNWAAKIVALMAC